MSGLPWVGLSSLACRDPHHLLSLFRGGEMGWWASWGRAGGRQSSRHGSEKERTPPNSADCESLRTGHSQQFTLHRVLGEVAEPPPFSAGSPQRAGEPAVLRLLVVHCSVSFSPRPHPHVNVSVSRVPAGSYYRNCSSFPFIFVSLLIRKLGKKAICLEWEVRLHRGA